LTRDAWDVLKARAEVLARRPEDDAASRASAVIFVRGGKVLAIPPDHLESSGRLKVMTVVPGAPGWIAGAIAYRDRILTLVDLPALWGETVSGMHDLPTYLVVKSGEHRIGLLVEELIGEQELDDAIKPYLGPDLRGVNQVAQFQGKTVWVLDGAKVIADARVGG
jgi:chemotaxis signal transduction protein